MSARRLSRHEASSLRKVIKISANYLMMVMLFLRARHIFSQRASPFVVNLASFFCRALVLSLSLRRQSVIGDGGQEMYVVVS